MKTILRNEVTFTTNLPSAPIPFSDLSAMILALKCEQDNGDATTLTIMLSLLHQLGISDKDLVLDGLPIDGEDLMVISTHFAGVQPEMVVAGGSAQFGFIGPIVLPLNMKGMAEGQVPSYHVDCAMHDYTDEETLTVGIEHGVPIGKRFHYTKKNDTADVAGTELNMSKPGKKMVALLMYATTKPTTANIQRSIKEIKILVNGKEDFHFNWFELDHGKCPKNLIDDLIIGPIIAHWRIIIFPGDGIPSDNLVVWTKSDTATNLIEFIGIYQGPHLGA